MRIKEYRPAFVSGFDDVYYDINSKEELLNSELCEYYIKEGFTICFSKHGDEQGMIMAIKPARNKNNAEWWVVAIIDNKQDIDTLANWLPDWHKLVEYYKNKGYETKHKRM